MLRKNINFQNVHNIKMFSTTNKLYNIKTVKNVTRLKLNLYITN